MHKLYNKTQDKFIVYDNYRIINTNIPSVIFLHGLMSSMQSTKAIYLIDYCKKNNYNFIVFDNFGHGNAYGQFEDQTISDWLEGVALILDKLIETEAILIGSSMGGWLALLAALRFPDKIKCLICVAPALDFTENIWQNISLNDQNKMKKEGIIEVSSENCQHKYPISYKLIEDAKKHLLLRKQQIEINIPVHIIHGMLDKNVPYNVSVKLLEKITSKQIVMKLIKDGNHNLSRKEDLKVIANSLEEMISNIK
ncbi:alpha/beta hydrolase [Rickettsia typhi]|uniref:Palmitoyl-protein thioesterase ABHD10, mitochondrial n=2 Tax=Rickettsia typhi TaxID=785 RepID=Q68X29_RICTY|nr:alpha/beta hydrolase [Rickettsia typhi]AAU03813.1 possible hydrolase [Rickettsia typhi str. Wilmington]AFE54190.1 hydrolase [Rickettsia typhi str. TH1527]AFE55030.1 hydrolase [Rickettsia typhi str. B9991CWPP]